MQGAREQKEAAGTFSADAVGSSGGAARRAVFARIARSHTGSKIRGIRENDRMLEAAWPAADSEKDIRKIEEEIKPW